MARDTVARYGGGDCPPQTHRSLATLGLGILLALWSSRATGETIQAALARAYANNAQLNAQRAALRQTDESVPQALSGYRPTINANAALGKQYTNTGVIVLTPPGLAAAQTSSNSSTQVTGTTTPRGVGLNATQTLYDGLKTANRTRAAEQQVRAGRETLRAVEQSVLLQAATVYMDLLRDLARLEIQKSNLRVLQKTLRDIQARFESGDITRTDVRQTEAQFASAEAALYSSEATVMATRANYRRIIGVEAEQLKPVEPPDRLLPKSRELVTQQAIANNPLIRAAIFGVDVALLQAKIAESELSPTLTLQGIVQKQLEPQVLTPSLTTALVTLNLNVPIYQGGKEYATIRQNVEAIGQGRFNVDQVRDQVRANTIQFWGQLAATRSQLRAAERQVKASESALDGVSLEARAGQRTTLDVLNAQQSLVTARLSLVVAQHDRVVAAYSLLASMGGLSAAALGLPATLYDPTIHYHQVRDTWYGLRGP